MISYKSHIINFFLLSFIYVIISCNSENNPLPKPFGYYRIDLPKNEYKQFDSTFPYKFEYSKYAIIKSKQNLKFK